MAKVLDDKMLEEILAEGSSTAYFFQKAKEKEERPEFKSFYEADGSVIVVFKTGIAKVVPEDEDLFGRVWKPRLKDEHGEPIIDKFGTNKGNPREPWDKFEAKAEVNGAETIYGFGGKNSILIRGFISELKTNELSITDMPGTKWRIKCVPDGRFNKWNIEYLDKAEPTPVESKAEPSGEYDQIADAVRGVRDDNRGMALAGIPTKDLLDALEYKAKLSAKVIEKYIPQLEKDEVIRIDGDKAFIQ